MRWLVTHCRNSFIKKIILQSHHIYVNSFTDFETSVFEPHIKYIAQSGTGNLDVLWSCIALIFVPFAFIFGLMLYK